MSKNKRNWELKFKAWDISIPLPTNPEPNSIFYVKNGLEFDIFPVDSEGNYLILSHPPYPPIPSGSVYGSELNIFQSLDIISNSSGVKEEIINDNTSILSIGKYIVKVDYSWNTNCTQHDFESFLKIGGVSISKDALGLIHKEEPKDSSGQWENTSSLQILSFSREYVIDITTVGARNISLAFRASKQNIKASIWDATVKIFRVN